MYRGLRVAVVVPAYREERLVGRMLRRLPPLVDSVHVVDDGSVDHTAEAAQAVGDERVHVIRHSENRGVGAAIVTGYLAALADGASALVVMAADDQMDPADLPALLDPLAEGRAHYVKGNRFAHAELRRMPFARRAAGSLLSALTRAATGLDVHDTQCGFTALARSAALCLPLEGLWPRYGYPNDLLGLLSDAGLIVAEVPVRPVYADEESGVRPWHAIVIAGIVARWALRLRRPRPALPEAAASTTEAR